MSEELFEDWQCVCQTINLNFRRKCRSCGRQNPARKEPMKFRPGDRVQCIRQSEHSAHKLDMGRIYTVADKSPYEGGIALMEDPRRTSAGHRFTHAADRFRLADGETARQQAPEPESLRWPDLQVGDVVRCINPGKGNDLTAGFVYRVSKVEPVECANGPMVRLEDKLQGAYAHRFELVKREEKLLVKTADMNFHRVDTKPGGVNLIPGTSKFQHDFKPGDRLRLTASVNLTAAVGSIAVVQDPVCKLDKAYVTPDMVNVVWEPHQTRDGGPGQQQPGHYFASHFERVQPESFIPDSSRKHGAFKPGDYVLYIGEFIGSLKNNKPYEVSAVEKYGEHQKIYLVDYPEDKGGYHPFWWSYRLKLWSRAEKTINELTRRGEAVQRVLEEEERRLAKPQIAVQRPFTMADRGYWQAYNMVFRSKNQGPAPAAKKPERKFPFVGSNPFNLKPWE